MEKQQNLNDNQKNNMQGADHLRTPEQVQADVRLRKILLGVSIGILVLTVAGMMYLGMVVKQTGILFNVVIFAGLALFWLIMDVIAPIVTHETVGMSSAQLTNLRFTALLDLAGYAGLGYFCVALNGRSGFYGVMVYALSVMFKRRLQNDLEESAQQAESEEQIESDDKEHDTFLPADDKEETGDGTETLKKDEASETGEPEDL